MLTECPETTRVQYTNYSTQISLTQQQEEETWHWHTNTFNSKQYQLLESLGKGGYAEVHLARPLFSDQPVAIKMPNMLIPREYYTSFVSEARMIARLNHPNVIRLLDSIHEPIPYMVLEYHPNGTLRDRHPHGSIVPLPTVIKYTKQIASALQHVHNHHIVHKDLKPENLLISQHDEIILTDFGIATDILSQNNLQSGTPLAGTPLYAAPEVISDHALPASDQYSLGLLVYEWLCGTPPFTGNSLSVLYQHVHKPARSLRTRDVLIPIDVENVIMRALSKDPDHRFASVTDFATALESAYFCSLA
jgi:serine/threonine protein kinase